MKKQTDSRREIASRNTRWAKSIARRLASWNITPNRISMLSIVFSAIGGGILLFSALAASLSLYVAFVLYAVCIQMRLLCNLFDGMVAVEWGKKTPNGDLYNDMPDRFADALLIIPAGYVAGGWGIELGWLAALLAVMTAYFRWIGAYKTKKHYFIGPMAKQHRMAWLTATALISLAFVKSGNYHQIFLISLIIMNAGLVITLARRLYFISRPVSEKE